MPKFRKIPVTIEAFRPFVDASPAWFQLAMDDGIVAYYPGTRGQKSDPPHFLIGSLEGIMRAIKGDWIIKGVKGELYPCKADIFAITYEAAE